MRGHDDTDGKLGRGAAQEIENEIAGGGIEIAGGFIGKEQPGTVDESARDGDALLLAARKLMGEALREVLQLDPTEAFLREGAGFRVMGEEQRQFHIFDGGEGVEELKRLKDEADFFAAKTGKLSVVEAGCRLAIDQNFAGGGEIHGTT